MLANLLHKKLSSSQTVYLAKSIQETYVLVRFPLFWVPSFNFWKNVKNLIYHYEKYNNAEITVNFVIYCTFQ